jgi:hypothetical protein
VKDEAIGRRFLSWEGGTFQQRLQYYWYFKLYHLLIIHISACFIFPSRFLQLKRILIPKFKTLLDSTFRNPKWRSGKLWFSSSIGRNILSIAFYNILLVIESRLIGLYDLASSNNLPSFGIIMICSTFSWIWKYPS